MKEVPEISPSEALKTPNGFTYPYLPEGRIYEYVGPENQWMQMAREYAREHSLDTTMPGAVVIVRNGEVIGIGANGSTYHDEYGCERVRQNVPSGQRYELCEGCHPKNHSEPSALRDAQERGNDVVGASVYLWGHWWCCESCWQHMKDANVAHVYLLEDSDTLFNKDAPGNVVGRQFETT